MTKQIIEKNRTCVYLSYLQQGIDKVFRGEHTFSHNTEKVTIAPETVFYYFDILFDDLIQHTQDGQRLGVECGREKTNKLLVNFLVNILTDKELPGLVDCFFENQRIKTLI